MHPEVRILLNTCNFMPPCQRRKERAGLDVFISLQIARHWGNVSLAIGEALCVPDKTLLQLQKGYKAIQHVENFPNLI